MERKDSSRDPSDKIPNQFARAHDSVIGYANRLPLTKEAYQAKLKEELSKSKAVEKYLANEKKEWKKSKKEPRLLILGTSDSGKSTLLKQLKILHGGGFSKQEIEQARVDIRKFVWKSCEMIAETKMQDLTHLFEKDIPGEEEALQSIEKVLKHGYSQMSEWLELQKNQVPDSTAYFLNEHPRIFQLNYIPTNEGL
jgi:hypothetical protein